MGMWNILGSTLCLRRAAPSVSLSPPQVPDGSGGHWDVRLGPGRVALMTGLLLQAATGGLTQATRHRCGSGHGPWLGFGWGMGPG